jgi:prolyl 4-hydroxylase
MSERLTSLTFQLTDVEKGGSTVFPYLKLNVKPQRRSAVFWYNLKHSGHNDFLTLHMGCPVLLGSKWVAK